MIVSIYVDDLIYTWNNVELFQRFKSHMIAEFEMTNLVTCIISWVLKSGRRKIVFSCHKPSMLGIF
jgi:hypothetical protein